MVFNIYCVLLLFFSLFLRAAPMAYGSSWARGQIRAAAAGLYHNHSNARSFNPLSEARNQTCILIDTSQVLNLLIHNRTSILFLLLLKDSYYLHVKSSLSIFKYMSLILFITPLILIWFLKIICFGYSLLCSFELVLHF